MEAGGKGLPGCRETDMEREPLPGAGGGHLNPDLIALQSIWIVLNYIFHISYV